MAIQIYIPNKCTNVHFSLYPYQHLLSHLFDDSHSDRYEVISHCGFCLQFPDDLARMIIEKGTLEQSPNVVRELAI